MMFFSLKLVTLTYAGALEHQLITKTRYYTADIFVPAHKQGNLHAANSLSFTANL